MYHLLLKRRLKHFLILDVILSTYYSFIPSSALCVYVSDVVMLQGGSRQECPHTAWYAAAADAAGEGGHWEQANDRCAHVGRTCRHLLG